jgi:hypothetical protein
MTGRQAVMLWKLAAGRQEQAIDLLFRPLVECDLIRKGVPRAQVGVPVTSRVWKGVNSICLRNIECTSMGSG